MTDWTNIFGGSTVAPAAAAYLAITLSSNTALVWPLETTESSPVLAAQLDVTATAPNLTLTLPPGNTGSTGVASLISNAGTNSVTLVDQGGNSIVTLVPTQSWLISLTDNSTTNGTWRAVQIGATVATVSAGQLAGPGLTTIGQLLATQIPEAPLDTNTFITSSFRSKAIVWQGATGTLQLDEIVNLTPGWFCLITNEGTGALTISTSVGQTINGAGSVTIQPSAGGIIICSDTGFDTFGLLDSPLAIANGGTGASNAPAAVIGLGATTIGNAIFTAPSASSVISILGLRASILNESTVSTSQVITASSSGVAFVCSASINLSLPLTANLTTSFLISVYAANGAITLTPQASDQIFGGGGIGAALLLAQGESLLLITDTNGVWYPMFLGLGNGGTINGNLTVVSNTTTGTLTVNGQATLGAALSVTGLATLSGNEVVTGAGATITTSANSGASNIVAINQAAAGPAVVGLIVNISNVGGHMTNWALNGSIVGSVTTNGSGTFYNTTSDKRLKIDDGLMLADEPGWIIDRLKVHWFRWKAGGDGQDPEPGFFAQQVARVAPWAVRKSRGRPGRADFQPWQIDTSKLNGLLVAELQALRRRVALLERAAKR